MIDPGKMRHRVTFLEYDGARGDYGESLDADPKHWRDVFAAWAAVDPVSGKEFYEAGQQQSMVTHKVRLRYRPGITTAMRLRHRERVLEIVSVINWEERNESLLLMCKEMVP